MSDYKPTENSGLRKDGQPDQRVGTGEFAHGKVDPHEAGKQGGHVGGTSSSGGSTGEAGGGSENPQGSAHLGGEGLRKDGQPDQRLKGNQS